MADSDPEQLKLQVEAWKTTVAVQQHFNDIGLKIRGLAITVLTAVLAAAVVAIRDGSRIQLGSSHFGLGAAIFMIGFVAWVLFYFVDQVWYHRLLLGAVKQGEHLEALLEPALPGIGLTTRISKESPYPVRIFFGKLLLGTLHSRHKLKIFYFVVALALLALTIATGAGGIAKSTNGSSTTSTTSASIRTLRGS